MMLLRSRLLFAATVFGVAVVAQAQDSPLRDPNNVEIELNFETKNEAVAWKNCQRFWNLRVWRSAPLANVTSVGKKQLNFGNGSNDQRLSGLRRTSIPLPPTADPPPKASDHCFWGFFLRQRQALNDLAGAQAAVADPQVRQTPDRLGASRL
jgi:hypothetical protein